ncbi:luciferase family oxidoreductase group 1 [Silvibacterium bohemicum]|uniref:Luciferase-like monooxygenase n=1 Tax=Silvibacterium bohemicum TaxID=1577686 RepID=A0A841JV59_9BACT|nr:LLM class flavin-dependent oxidoreductase [Silvibacterium bohemicum]MBB6142318.1 luciferase family oxidoreductase group 1 [Silvibacterium bohemicum]
MTQNSRTQDSRTQNSRLARTPLSVLDLAHVRQGGTIADAFRNTLDMAQHAERWGYKRFWLAEHHNIAGVASAATSVLIGHIAGGTSTIRVGSGGIMLPNHAPLVIAEQFGTLETLYPGRIDLGLGRAPGGDFAVTRALRKDLRANGDDFPALLEELQHYFAPVQPGQTVTAIPGAGIHVPIWLLGSSGFSAALAAELGLPFAFAAHFQPDNLLPALDLYRRSFKPSKILDRPYAMAGIPVLAAETDEEAEFLATTPQQMFLNLIRNRPVPLMPPVRRMEWDAFEQSAVEAKFRAAIVGGPETVRQKLELFLDETQVDEVMIASNPYEHSARLRSYEIVAELAGISPRRELSFS